MNKDTCPIEITKWSDLADPALKGQIVSTDIDRRFVATTLAENGFDPNSESQADLDAVFDWLCQFNSNVKVYDNGAPRTSLENGDCSVAFTYTTDYVLIKQEDPTGNYELVTLPDGWRQPEGMCDSAWSSISPFVMTLACGGSDIYKGWMKNKKSAMVSCNDGFRPVSFYIEALEEEASDWF